MRLRSNVEHYDGSVVTMAITAPGKDVLVDDEAMHRWNSTAAVRWRALHRAAAQAARRRHGRFRVLAWTWEYQRRGALHKHVVLGADTARELAAAHTYVAELDRLRHRHGFGFVDRGRKRRGQGRALEVIPPARAGRYLAKYLSPLGKDSKPTLSETVVREDVPPLVVFVSRSLTSETGMTMRYLQ